MGALSATISIIELSTASRPKQTCVEDIGGGFGGNTLGEHDYQTIGDQWPARKGRDERITYGMRRR